MKPLQDTKHFKLFDAVADDAAPASNVIDTAGAAYIELLIDVSSIDADMASLVLNHSDAKTNATTLDAGVLLVDLGALADLALPTQAAGPQLIVVGIDLHDITHKRFLHLVPTAGNGAAGSALRGYATLGQLERTSSDAASRGVDQAVYFPPQTI